jgi:DNA (cytosine-5)-methyltransferase 1
MRTSNPLDWILGNGIFAKSFPVKPSSNQLSIQLPSLELKGDLIQITKHFNMENESPCPFLNSGLMIERKIWTLKTSPQYNGPIANLGDKLQAEAEVPEQFFIPDKEIDKWRYLKGSKDEKRHNKTHDFWYRYSEGAIPFPDHLDKPSRTIITSEGGAAPSRFKHVILTPSGRYRRLTPMELEKLNMFPENHTVGYTDVARAFLMGNALVVGAIQSIGKELIARLIEL